MPLPRHLMSLYDNCSPPLTALGSDAKRLPQLSTSSVVDFLSCRLSWCRRPHRLLRNVNNWPRDNRQWFDRKSCRYFKTGISSRVWGPNHRQTIAFRYFWGCCKIPEIFGWSRTWMVWSRENAEALHKASLACSQVIISQNFFDSKVNFILFFSMICLN